MQTQYTTSRWRCIQSTTFAESQLYAVPADRTPNSEEPKIPWPILQQDCAFVDVRPGAGRERNDAQSKEGERVYENEN
jgi:hypothetical protein